MKKSDFSVGQKVYLKIIEGSNADRYISRKDNPDAWIKEKIVTKVGRKYVTVADSNLQSGEEKFDIENNFAHVYTLGGRDYILFLSRENILEYMEINRIYKQIRSAFSSYDNNDRYSLEQLKKVRDVLELTSDDM